MTRWCSKRSICRNTSSRRKKRSVSVAVPSLPIQLPKSTVIVPEPIELVGKANPVNSKFEELLVMLHLYQN